MCEMGAGVRRALVPDDGLFEAAVPCRDAVGRRRGLRIAQTRLGEISIITPPGGSATVTPDQIALVREAFDDVLRRVTKGGTS